MSDAAASEEVKLTREQYEQLLKGPPLQTITVDVAEYNKLLAAKTELDALKPMHDRVTMRMRELEMCLRREQMEHQAEVNGLIAEIRKYRPPPAA